MVTRVKSSAMSRSAMLVWSLTLLASVYGYCLFTLELRAGLHIADIADKFDISDLISYGIIAYLLLVSAVDHITDT